ncbi:ATP-dependent DNA helicase PIF1-like protein [Tanacetum coccineum]
MRVMIMVIILSHINDPTYFQEKAILAPTNEVVDTINEHLLNSFPGEEMVYLSCDNIDKSENGANIDQSVFSPEFINGLKFSGIPNHKLVLKVGVPICFDNDRLSNGLCNGTKLQVVRLERTSIQAQIINGTHFGKTVIIPRLKISPSVKCLRLKIVRKQYHVSVSFAMTINKSQGQSLSRVGLYLPRPVFTHGQLYLAVSRSKAIRGLKVDICDQDATLRLVLRPYNGSELFDVNAPMDIDVPFNDLQVLERENFGSFSLSPSDVIYNGILIARIGVSAIFIGVNKGGCGLTGESDWTVSWIWSVLVVLWRIGGKRGRHTGRLVLFLKQCIIADHQNELLNVIRFWLLKWGTVDAAELSVVLKGNFIEANWSGHANGKADDRGQARVLQAHSMSEKIVSDEYLKYHGYSPVIVTGKLLEDRWEERRQMAVVLLLPQKHYLLATGRFGNVGSWVARLVHELNVKIIAVIDVTEAVRNPDGIDIPAFL